jgi:hypothetical protein
MVLHVKHEIYEHIQWFLDFMGSGWVIEVMPETDAFW